MKPDPILKVCKIRINLRALKGNGQCCTLVLYKYSKNSYFLSLTPSYVCGRLAVGL